MRHSMVRKVLAERLFSSDDLERRPVDSSTRLGPFSAARLCFLLSTLKRLNMKKTNFSLKYQRAAYNSVF